MKLVHCFVLTLLSTAAMAQLGGPAPPDHEPLRNAFIRASETVLDDIQAVDLSGNAVAINGQMDAVKVAQQNLTAMAETERERIALASVNDAVFALHSCRIVAADGQDTATCRKRVAQDESDAMEAIGKHRQNGAWLDGPPQ